ncbi:MAG: hypothetical protein A2Y62_00870 [Candidatus Fischerbacteria bacterium RBG_13_37_8]|uniref:Uncharacterized protein n=1 Tax=Candidatus Fischerbacteria bacterium RBG_13_37_8 TaxID=1817863 RepID=A0A1F5VJH2_9BACT|nr:MAG: hypothetical protein A2Y62_00870 [Candidatus Fischerbacteria bacterium RBG_13_37_8]
MKKVADLTIQELQDIMGKIIDNKIKKYMEEWEATLELMDRNILQDYLEAKEEINRGKVVKWKTAKRNV